jgi:hypothetical protein
MIGAFGSSNFKAIAVMDITGVAMTRNRKENNKSNSLFVTLHQFSRVVFFISITGIELMSVSSVLAELISKEFVIYLYLIP